MASYAKSSLWICLGNSAHTLLLPTPTDSEINKYKWIIRINIQRYSAQSSVFLCCDNSQFPVCSAVMQRWAEARHRMAVGSVRGTGWQWSVCVAIPQVGGWQEQCTHLHCNCAHSPAELSWHNNKSTMHVWCVYVMRALSPLLYSTVLRVIRSSSN